MIPDSPESSHSPPVGRLLFTLFPAISLMMVMVSLAASC
jgi:hypothetical protein